MEDVARSRARWKEKAMLTEMFEEWARRFNLLDECRVLPEVGKCHERLRRRGGCYWTPAWRCEMMRSVETGMPQFPMLLVRCWRWACEHSGHGEWIWVHPLSPTRIARRAELGEE